MSSNLGAGRLLIAVYWVFAVSASARALYQLANEFDKAPVAYSLSALSAGVYVLATIALAGGERRPKLALWTLVFELVGVLVVGTLSLTAPELFAHPSVWSGYGVGYGFIPLVLPVLGLIWLWRRSARNH